MSPRPRTRAVRRPTDRPSRALKAVVDENVARMNVIDGLYQPIREAADAELGKIEAGRKLLKDQRALVKRLRQLRARRHGRAHRLRSTTHVTRAPPEVRPRAPGHVPARVLAAGTPEPVGGGDRRRAPSGALRRVAPGLEGGDRGFRVAPARTEERGSG